MHGRAKAAHKPLQQIGLALSLAGAVGLAVGLDHLPISGAYLTSQSALTDNVIKMAGSAPPPSSSLLEAWLLAVLDVRSRSLGQESYDQDIVAFIEPPAGYGVADIQQASLRLCLGTPHCTDGVHAGGKPEVDDADRDGIPDLKVTFAQSEVLALLHGITPPAWVTVTVSGLVGAQGFAGSDTLKLVDPEREGVPTSPRWPAAPATTATCTPTGTDAPTATSTATVQPSGTPTPAVTPAATATAEPTTTPSSATAEPNVTPSPSATSTPTDMPTATPTTGPPDTPTATPAAGPTDAPTAVPPS